MREVLKPVTGSSEDFQVASGSGDTNEGRITGIGALSDGLKERRPLQAVIGVKVEDVDLAVVINRLEDCLVWGEVREAEEWGDLVEGQV